jgi:iron complex transport system ATP-binding protein
VLEGVTLVAARGTIHGVIGPNGAGKSSLLRLVAGLHRPVSGRVLFEGEDAVAMSRQKRARLMALTEQSAASDVRLSVYDAVMLGRIPFQSNLQTTPSAEDRTVVEQVLATVGMSRHGRRDFTSLSGGEQQRIQIARALAQEPRLLLLDEPTNHLDIEAQLAIAGLLRISAASGTTIVIAIHDLNLASEFCDEITVMAAGKSVARGHPAEIVTPALLRDVYGVDATILTNPRSGRPLVAAHAPSSGLAPMQMAPLRLSA